MEPDDTYPQDDPDNPSIFVNVSILLLLQIILKVVPGLKSALSSLREALDPQGVHATILMELCNPILHLCTWIEVTVLDTPIKAVLDTAGVESIKSNGAYSSVPLRFGELVVTYLAVVLDSESYDMLIGTYFLRTYQTEINHLHEHFSILGYTVPLLFKDSLDVFLVSKEETGFPPKAQVAVDTGLYLDLPPGLHFEINSINGVLCKEPLAAPGIRDSAAQETLKVLLLIPLSMEIKVSKVHYIATLRIGHNEDLTAVYFLGGLEELGISLPDKPLVAAIIPQDNMVGLAKDKKDSFEALLDKFCYKSNNFDAPGGIQTRSWPPGGASGRGDSPAPGFLLFKAHPGVGTIPALAVAAGPIWGPKSYVQALVGLAGQAIFSCPPQESLSSQPKKGDQIGKTPITPEAKPARTNGLTSQDGPPKSQTTVPENPKNDHEEANQTAEPEMSSLATQIAPEECPVALICE
ncbi:hypothetical protein DSO57_1032403 [Entomophthora muscae]|uniref:Uncharacterized protein n=1 Tax=Entomophthora muscae TaxID=34485 RepID=A0ACC2RRI4_9FUNG|nr:hypothetical protein DSO57_1032403 [Entomophthora muscae]